MSDRGSAKTSLPIDVASAQTLATASAATMASAPPATMPAHADALPVVVAAAYVKIDEIGRGGLGRILRARDQRTGRTVAIKEMLATTEDAAVRFVREALVTANLQHPAIVPVYEVGRWPGGQPFYAMKLVRGRPLNELIDACTDIDQRLALVPHVIAVADALAYAHGERVIHRDLKPHNVLCGSHGETVVIDWGLARRIDDADVPVRVPRISSAPPGLTYVGAVLGTPAFMAPEQARGERVDERADVYAIGAILYHALAGKPPYTGKTLAELIAAVRAAPPPRLAAVARGVPPDLATIVERAMARDRHDRYPSAIELVTELRRFHTGQLVQAHHYTTAQRVRRFAARHRAALAIAATALVTLAVVATVSLTRIVDAREVAEDQKQRADRKRDEAQQRLLSAYVDRARVELSAGHPDRALPFVVAAGELGGLDPMLRFVAARAIDSLPAVKRQLDPGVTGAVFAPGSHDLLIGNDQGARRWSPATGKVIWTLSGDTGDMVAIDDKTVALGRDHAVVVVSAADGTIEANLEPHAGTTLLGYIGIDRARRWIAAPTADGKVDVFDVASRARVASVPVPAVDRVPLISPDGQRFLVGAPVSTFVSRLFIVDRAGREWGLCDDCHVYAYAPGGVVFAHETRDAAATRVVLADWSGRTRLEITPQSTGSVNDLAIDHERGLLALAIADGTIEVRDVATGAPVWRRATRDRAYQVTFDRAGRLWVLGSYAGVITYDARSGTELGHWQSSGHWLGLSSDEQRVAIIQHKRGIDTWPVPVATRIAIAPSAARVRKLLLLDGDRVASGSDDGRLVVHDLGKPPREITKLSARVSQLQELPDKTVLVSSADNTTAIWDVVAARELVRFPLGLRAEASPDGSHIAIGSSDGAITLWHRSGAKVRELGRLDKSPMAVRWSPDGRHIAAIDELAAVTVWDRDGTVVRTIPATKGGIDVAFTPDGKWLARAGRQATELVLYALAPGVKDRPLAGAPLPDTQSFVVEFSRDGHRLLQAGSGFVRVWDVATGQAIHEIAPATDVIAARFSPDQRLIYTGGVDQRLRVWDAMTGSELMSLPATADIYGIVTTQDGERLGVLTLGAAFVWRTGAFRGDAGILQRIARCRTPGEVRDGALRERAIDIAACNRAD